MPTYGPKHSYTGSSSGVLYTDRRRFYIKPQQVAELYPSEAPFITFLLNLKSMTTPDPDFKLFEHRSIFHHMTGYIREAVDWDTSGSYVAAHTGIEVGNTAGASAQVQHLVAGDIIEVRASADGARNSGSGVSANIDANDVIARCRVTAISGNTVTVTAISKDADGADTYDLAIGDPFVVITHADAEGSGSPEAWSDELEVVWNSTQIIKTPVEITGTLYEMALRGYSSELARLRAEKAKEHLMKCNRAVLLNHRIGGTGAPTGHLTDADGYQIRTTMGAIQILDVYGTDDEQVFERSWGSYTLDDFIDDMEASAQYDNAKLEKFAFAGSTVLAELSKTGPDSFFARAGGSISLSDWRSTSMGFDVRTLTHPFGKIHISWDPSMRYLPYKNMMAVFDPDQLGHVIFRSDQYQTALQDNDEDKVKDQYFSDMGLAMTLVERNSLWKFK